MISGFMVLLFVVVSKCFMKLLTDQEAMELIVFPKQWNSPSSLHLTPLRSSQITSMYCCGNQAPARNFNLSLAGSPLFGGDSEIDTIFKAPSKCLEFRHVWQRVAGNVRFRQRRSSRYEANASK